MSLMELSSKRYGSMAYWTLPVRLPAAVADYKPSRSIASLNMEQRSVSRGLQPIITEMQPIAVRRTIRPIITGKLPVQGDEYTIVFSKMRVTGNGLHPAFTVTIKLLTTMSSACLILNQQNKLVDWINHK
ncbi:hypothetical protein ACG10_20705 [Azotobacter chroococcum]|nr:hypothetical protein ACG10_20705 [Azotobacter chroococcum]